MKHTYRKISQDPDVHHVVEFLKNRFYFVTVKSRRSKFNTPELHYFSIDDILKYKGYYSDFGPLHLGNLYKYSVLVDTKLRSDWLKHKAIIHYTISDYEKHSNSAFLAGAFAVMFLKLTSDEVWKLLSAGQMRYTPFRDASYAHALGLIPQTITVLDCLRAIEKAVKFKFFDFRDFDEHHFKLFEVQEYSELNWIVPEKLVAFCNPGNDRGSPVNIQRLVKYFILNNVGVVVRLNNPDYSPRKFGDSGIRHIDMFFEDGSPPPFEILQNFINLVETTQSAIAVHCKAGLGRTGCLIGSYLIKHYRLTSSEAIAWMRICRPGMVVGVQNEWLRKMETWLWRAGDNWRIKMHKSKDVFPVHARGIYSKQTPYRSPVIQRWIEDIEKCKNERLKKKMVQWKEMLESDKPLTQGDYLLAVKKMRQGVERCYTR